MAPAREFEVHANSVNFGAPFCRVERVLVWDLAWAGGVDAICVHVGTPLWIYVVW